jgi:stage II sporulation protein P
MKRSQKLIVGIVLLLLSWFSLGTAASAADLPPETYYTLQDTAGAVILLTAFPVNSGDVYIAADNTRYVVETLAGVTAYCREDGREVMPQIGSLQAAVLPAGVLTRDAPPVIGLYHTHSDESYVPTDGTESKEQNGGIEDVGAVLKQALEAGGFSVLHSTENHNPHDANAYSRSRKTAAELLREGAGVLIDVHRDAVPAEVYATEVNGEEATKVKLVVGRSNPGMNNNLAFAKTLKAALDQAAPGLSGGIYMGKGVYNQDLSPRAILIEVGAHTNSKEAAETGAELFADAIPAALGAENTDSPAKSSGQGQDAGGAWAATLVILGLVALILGGVYWVNHPAGKH